jgi:hypothetical protein
MMVTEGSIFKSAKYNLNEMVKAATAVSGTPSRRNSPQNAIAQKTALAAEMMASMRETLLAGRSPEYMAQFEASLALMGPSVDVQLAEAALYATKRAEEAERNASGTAEPGSAASRLPKHRHYIYIVRFAPNAPDAVEAAASLQAQLGTLSLRAQGEICDGCGVAKVSSAVAKPKTCQRCLATWYCTKSCQAKHWKEGGYKQACRVPGDFSAFDLVHVTSTETCLECVGRCLEVSCVICFSGRSLLLACVHKDISII